MGESWYCSTAYSTLQDLRHVGFEWNSPASSIPTRGRALASAAPGTRPTAGEGDGEGRRCCQAGLCATLSCSWSCPVANGIGKQATPCPLHACSASARLGVALGHRHPPRGPSTQHTQPCMQRSGCNICSPAGGVVPMRKMRRRPYSPSHSLYARGPAGSTRGPLVTGRWGPPSVVLIRVVVRPCWAWIAADR